MTKFRDLLHAKAFIARGLGIDAITEDQVDQVMECEITGGGINHNATAPDEAFIWSNDIESNMLRAIYYYDESWRAPSPTTPLPIVKPCHRCGESHDEANPPMYCVRILELEAERERLQQRIDRLECEKPIQATT